MTPPVVSPEREAVLAVVARLKELRDGRKYPLGFVEDLDAAISFLEAAPSGTPEPGEIRAWEVVDKYGDQHSLVGKNNKRAADENCFRWNESEKPEWESIQPLTVRPLVPLSAHAGDGGQRDTGDIAK